MKNFDPKAWFMPQAVIVIGTYDADGTPNAMNWRSSDGKLTASMINGILLSDKAIFETLILSRMDTIYFFSFLYSHTRVSIVFDAFLLILLPPCP